jgi:lipoprotein-anchoring transpeptidase ErfK/SrfK
VNAGGDVDTYSRYVYIHGTNREEQLGTPASSGCVQMSNTDIIQLYDVVRTGDHVWIAD